MSDVPAPVEQTKPVEVLETPAVLAAGEPAKVEETPVITETPAAVVEETPATGAPDTPATEDQKEEVKTTETPKGRKSPSLLSKIIAPFKSDKKSKAPKSPKKEKKKEEVETPALEETPKPEETLAATDVAAEPPKEVSEPVKETETPAAEASVPAEASVAAEATGEKKEERKYKFSRRLSARVGDLFKKKSEAPTTARVDELPPKIDEPTPVAPLENPATDASVPAETPAETEPAKSVEAVPTATPIVAAAA